MKIGDYVVHENSGIGRYTGIEQISVNGIKKDYLKIIYQGGDNLYVPIDQMDKVQKYIGSDAEKVKLNKLGTNEWTKAKAKSKVINSLKILFGKKNLNLCFRMKKLKTS